MERAGYIVVVMAILLSTAIVILWLKKEIRRVVQIFKELKENG